MCLDNIKGIVLLLSGLACMQTAAAQVPVEKETHHKIVLENEWVRVFEGNVPPNDTTPSHIHSANSVVVFLSKTGLGIRLAGQQPTVTPVAPGDIRYVNYGDKPITHVVWAQGDSVLRFLVVELKKPKMDSCPVPGIKILLQQKQVKIYNWDPKTDLPAILPAAPCARMVIVPSTGAFTFYLPNTTIRAPSKCLLLQL
jgi:hypothetical protein